MAYVEFVQNVLIESMVRISLNSGVQVLGVAFSIVLLLFFLSSPGYLLSLDGVKEEGGLLRHETRTLFLDFSE